MVIGRVLNLLAWRRKCDTGRLSVPCKTKMRPVEKVQPLLQGRSKGWGGGGGGGGGALGGA